LETKEQEVSKLQVLIVAEGLDIPTTPKTQMASVRACIEQLWKDPRVRNIWGFTGQSIGCCIVGEVANYHEAERLAAFLQVSGLPNTQVYPLVAGDQLQVGLEEAEAIVTLPAATRRQAKAE